MMAFLRRLAPPLEADGTRAFALLPARFAEQRPLDGLPGQAHPVQPADDASEWIPSDPALSPVDSNALEARRGRATSVQPSHTAPDPLAGEAMRRANRGPVAPVAPVENTRSAAHPAPARRAMPVPSPQAVPVQEGEHRARARPDEPAATPAYRHGAAVPDQARLDLPLSQATLAQRALQSHNESQVVQVTIGRIDVVANTAPAPAAQRTPSPRQATTTLADYLRGGGRGRQ